MLIDISVGSRFHAFDLARELDQRRAMRTLYTGYQAFSASRFGLRSGILRSVWTHEPLNRLFWRLRAAGILRDSRDARLSARFDRIVARRLKPGADIFIGWSSQCRHSLGRAKDLGMKTIVERGSSHVLWQHRILAEEQALTGLPAELPSSATIEQELAEYAAADFIAVPTHFAARTFTEHGLSAAKLLVNPYGVDTGRFAGVERFLANGMRVLHVGRCSMRKGIHHLIEATRLVANAHLTMVGGIDPGMGAHLKQRHTTVVGPVSGNNLPTYYADADVFCLLSLEEGLALVIAQAMASGLPVIVTPNTGGEELVTDGVEGFVVPIRSPAVVAERLCWLRDNPAQRLAMGRRARERIQAGFSWSDYGDRALSNYRHVLSKREAGGGANCG